MFNIDTVNNENDALNRILITNKEASFKAEIYPNLGASLQSLCIKNLEFIDGISNSEEGLETYKKLYNSAFLFPFPSRIPDGKYNFEGKSYELNPNETALNNALHGFIQDKHFKLSSQKSTANNAEVVLSHAYNESIEGYPFPFVLEVIYTCSSESLSVQINVKNTGDTPLPFGIGWHPYFNVNEMNTAVLNFDAQTQYELDNRMIPTKEIELEYNFPLTIGATELDNCFISKSATSSFETKDYQFSLEFTSESERNFIQVYTPPTRKSIAIEPMTCAPNCFNNGDGLLTLAPNEKFNWFVNMKWN